MNQADFLASRIAYLNNLSAIGEGWISDGAMTAGIAPDPVICALAVSTLQDLLSNNVDVSTDQLILGPVPAGGICIEVRSAQCQAILILLNSNASECSTKISGGEWEHIELPHIDAVALFKRMLLPTAV